MRAAHDSVAAIATFWLDPWGVMLEGVCHHERDCSNATKSVVML
ncbi:hypothetical protein ACVWWN_005610 [Mycobacterium sp. URHB0021]